MAVLVLMGTAPLSAAEVHRIVLEHGKISKTQVEAHVGDKVEIVHVDDDDIHALYSTTPGFTFDLSKMKHGDHFDLELTEAGTITVRCHKMKMMELTIVVSD